MLVLLNREAEARGAVADAAGDGPASAVEAEA